MRAWVLMILLTPTALAAQTVTSASVTGTVRDTSAGVVPGAMVEARHSATNQASRAATDARGRFTFLYLPVGDYRLSVEMNGFQTTTTDLRLSVGDKVDVPIVLRPAGVTTAVEVSAPIVDARRTEASAAITPQEVDTLPLNGRNYLDLATLAPNVSRTNLRSTDRFAETSAVPGTGISVAGQRNLGNSFIVDGLSANDDAADLAGTFFSEDVIREFQVVTSGGAAEFGRASSGTISVVTKSGANAMSGRAYEFFRNDALDARSPLAPRKDAAGSPLKDPLNQHQFGFSLGGPLARDRTFWFGNVERTSLRRTGIVTIAPSSVAAVNSVLDASQGYRGPRLRTGNYPTGYDTTNLFGRVDHQATPASKFQLRYSLYRVASENARNVGALGDVSRGTALEDTDQTIAVNFLSATPGMVNEARAQYTRSGLAAPPNDLTGPAVNISGVANWGTATSSPTRRDLNVFQAIDTITLQRGDHVFKAGADVLYNRVTITFPGAFQGVYTFSSLPNFQRGVYQTFQQAFGASSQDQSNPNLGLFAQDEWRARADLTINAGLRYDLQWLPGPIQLDTNNVSPRLGMAYAPGDGRTVIRVSGGLYFDRIPLRATSNALQRDGTKYQVAQLSFGLVGAPVFPAILPSFPTGVLVSITNINPEIRDGHSEQANLQIERTLGAGWSATLAYNYLRGHGIIMSRNVNVPTLTVAQASALGVPNLGRPNPRQGNISQYDSLGDSWFNGLTASLMARTGRWGRTRISYTLSRALDDAGNAFFQTPQDNFNILGDKGPSDNDQRHRLVVSGTFGAPSTSSGRAGIGALGGLQIGYVFSYATAAPFNVVTGADRNNDTTVNDRPEGVERNSARLPCFSTAMAECGTSSFDLRLSRAFTFDGRHRLELLAEAFNLFNHVNVVNVNNTFGTGTTPSPTLGQVNAINDMRQIQLGVRWSF